jgi:hypothetical protein
MQALTFILGLTTLAGLGKAELLSLTFQITKVCHITFVTKFLPEKLFGRLKRPRVKTASPKK